MLYRVLADVVVVVHFAFVLYVVLGGLLVVRWPWTAFVHLPVLAWGALIETMLWVCPLTPLENALRRAAGSAGYSGGFVEHYVIPVLYPANLGHPTHLLLAALLIVFNATVYALVLRRRKKIRPPPA